MKTPLLDTFKRIGGKLNEAYAWERQPGKPLPTIKEDARDIEPDLHAMLDSHIESINHVADKLRDLQMEIISGLQMYEDETNDSRVEKIIRRVTTPLNLCDNNLESLIKIIQYYKRTLA
jgi:hypothetical protein